MSNHTHSTSEFCNLATQNPVISFFTTKRPFIIPKSTEKTTKNKTLLYKQHKFTIQNHKIHTDINQKEKHSFYL